jgi:DNA-binding transcriptional ArsR family regulator
MSAVATRSPGHAEPAAANPDEAIDDRPPDAELLVSDSETLKALSDPLRLRILEAMVARLDAPWSAKELAARLGVPQTRLYHHIELLLERGLIRAAGQRVVSGIIETRYRVAALSFRLDRRLLSGNAELQDGGLEVLHTVFDTTREDLARALQRHARADRSEEAAAADDHGDPASAFGTDPDRPILTRGLARLSPSRAAEFRERVLALISEFESDTESAAAETWGLLLAFYRQDGDPAEASND